MEDSEWIGRLLDASRAALERVSDPALDVDHALLADLAQLATDLEAQLADLLGSPGSY